MTAVAERAFYRLVVVAMHIVVSVVTLGGYAVQGRRHVPHDGGLIVVANHLNNADPPLLAAAIPRRIHFMAKQELFDQKPWGFFIRLFGAFPVRRFEADVNALRTAQRYLAAGDAIGMFPEGHRSRNGGLQTLFPGTAVIALRTGAALLPVAITGTEAVRSPKVLIARPRITVTIGEPFALGKPQRVTSEAVREGTEEIMRRIAALLPPTYHGVYAETAAGSPSSAATEAAGSGRGS